MITYNILRLNEWFDLRIKDMTGLGNYDDLNHTDNLVESDMRELFTFIITAKKDDDNEDCYEVHVWDYTGRLLVCQPGSLNQLAYSLASLATWRFTFLTSSIIFKNRSNKGATSCGPGLASGCPWKQNAGLSVRSRPCTEPSNKDR